MNARILDKINDIKGKREVIDKTKHQISVAEDEIFTEVMEIFKAMNLTPEEVLKNIAARTNGGWP